jgi:hypothetical protein
MKAAEQAKRDAEAGRLLDRMRPLAARYYQLTQKAAGSRANSASM